MNINNRIYHYKPNGNWDKRDVSKLRHLVVHHSVYALDNQSNDARLKTMMGWHTKQNWQGLSYHYIIMKDGQIYQINNDDDLTWTDHHNSFSLSILVDGYFHPPKNDIPTTAQIQSLHWLTDHLLKRYPQINGDNRIIAHRDVSRIYGTPPTSCCGDTLYPQLDYIKNTPYKALSMTEQNQLNDYIKRHQDALNHAEFNKLETDEKIALSAGGAPNILHLVARLNGQRKAITDLQTRNKKLAFEADKIAAERNLLLQQAEQNKTVIVNNPAPMQEETQEKVKPLPVYKRAIFDTFRDGSYALGGVLAATGSFELASEFIATGDLSQAAFQRLGVGILAAMFGYLQALQKERRKEEEKK